MAGPFLPGRSAQPLDLLEGAASGGGWEELEAMFKPHLQDAPLQPDDVAARFLWGMYTCPIGRAVIEWLMDITIRAPLRATGRSFEETALLTATRQGINGVGEAVLAAIAHGEKLEKQTKNQNGAGS